MSKGGKKQNYDAAYINLAKRADRRRDMDRSLRAAGVVASRFEAQTGEETPVQVVQLTWDSSLNAEYDSGHRPHPAGARTPSLAALRWSPRAKLLRPADRKATPSFPVLQCA